VTNTETQALRIRVEGVVQGVGFRPFVYRQATQRNVRGWVLNAVDGVTIHAEGAQSDLDGLVVAISEEAPAAAQVKRISWDEAEVEGFDIFEIRFSDDADVEETTLVSPDLATCDDCVRELFDPADRRYRYPFINCTNCGPRFTIIRELPYDRSNTSMAPFTMCPTCAAEYQDPADRRFHAQPDACFTCGPHLGWLESSLHHSEQSEESPTIDDIQWASDLIESDGLIDNAVRVLLEGGIVAVKGLGGYHLACDAANPEAVALLRQRKRRQGKAFAIMVAQAQDAQAICRADEAEVGQLEHAARPIVLLKKHVDVEYTPQLADALPEVGIMLPATPVQHLLVHDFAQAKQAQAADSPDYLAGVPALVMTSGNIHDEPIVTTEEAALAHLAEVADAFLVNDREVLSRYDDSVVRVLDGAAAGPVVQVIRRARGLAPMPLALPAGLEGNTFATGPEQKCTFTLTRGKQAFVSQHIGDMEDASTFDAWLETKALYQNLFQVQPTQLACDKHPEYLTSKWAAEQAMPATQTQHHHAHIVAAMAENNLEGPVCGFAFDGTGYGVDGAIWGGEVLLANLHAFERFTNVAYFPLPGGAAAIKHPERTAYGLLWATDLLDHPAAQTFVASMQDDSALLSQMVEQGINSPLTSSMGRLFDAVSALCGICTQPTYEGEAAILLEAAIHELALREPKAAEQAGAYPFTLIKNSATPDSTAEDTSVALIDPAPALETMLQDLQDGVEPGLISARFHNGIVLLIGQLAELIRTMYDINTVVLAGGVFMNRYLLEQALSHLQEAGFTVALNRELPPNDASISYGQAVIALHSKNKE